MAKNIYYIFVLLLIFQFLNAQILKNIYVDIYSIDQCEDGIDCGTDIKPFTNLFYAIKLAESSASTSPFIQILVAPGAYQGPLNKGLVVKDFSGKSLTIKSQTGYREVLIDCMGNGQFLNVENSKQFTLDGFVVKNCVSYQGSALYIDRTDVSVRNSKFLSNKAIQGGAVYLNSSKSSIFTTVEFEYNVATEVGSALFIKSSGSVTLNSNSFIENKIIEGIHDGFACLDSTIRIYSPILQDWPAQIYCGSSCTTILEDRDLICKTPPREFTQTENNPIILQQTKAWDIRNLDRAYDYCYEEVQAECGSCTGVNSNCLNCLECPCYESGLLLRLLSKQGDSSMTCERIREIVDISNGSPIDLLSDDPFEPMSATLKGYVKVKKSKKYTFFFESTNIRVNVKIDGRVIHNAQPQIPSGTSSLANVTLYMVPNVIYTLEIEVGSQPISMNEKREISISYRDQKNVEIYYSNSACGDRLSESGSPGCTIQTPLYDGISYCGDGICNEANPNLCLADCYDHITQVCESRKVPFAHIPAGFITEYDTLGNLIDNQQIYHLPGVEHFSMGQDLVTGKPAVAPLFYFDYCTDKTENIIQDIYRVSTFELPKELSGKILPQCSFSTETTSYTSTEEIRKEKSEQTTMSFQASLSGGAYGYAASGSAAYSKDSSVEQAESISTESTKTYFKSEVGCSISSVDMVKYTFHPIFLREISQVKNGDDMMKIILKYGTHFIKSATLGGKLEMTTATEEEMVSDEQESEWKESVKRSASVSFKSPVLSGGASYSDSSDTSQSLTQQQEKESKSSRTYVTASGGMPGSYGPGSYSEGKMFEDWAASIDLLPVPIEKDLYPIESIIPNEWTYVKPDWAASLKIRNLWRETEQKYYDLNQYSSTLPFKYGVFLHFKSSPTETITLPIIRIKWTSPLDGTTRTNIVRLAHKQNLGTNKDSIEYIPNFTTFDVTNGTTRSRKVQYVWTNGFFISESYGYIAESYSEQVRSPLRFDIELNEDFMTSTTKPEFIIDSMPNSTFLPTQTFIHFINFKTSKAVIINSNGECLDDNKVHVSSSFQSLGYGGEIPLINSHLIGLGSPDYVEFLTNLYGIDTQDYHKLFYGYEGDAVLTFDAMSIGKLKFNDKDTPIADTTMIYHYTSFSWEEGRELRFSYKQEDNAGSQKRINYLLAAIPTTTATGHPNTKWWLRNVLSYHCSSTGYTFPDTTGEFSGLKLPLVSLKTENSDYYFSTRNTLRYYPIFPTAPRYQPVGKYPLPAFVDYGRECSGMVDGHFYDLTTISNSDLNFTNNDGTTFLNICGRSLNCVESPLNLQGEPNIKSCMIRMNDSIVEPHVTSPLVKDGTSDYKFQISNSGLLLIHSSTKNIPSTCSLPKFINEMKLRCYPYQTEPIVKSFNVQLDGCIYSYEIRTAAACPPTVIYDQLSSYYYDLTNLKKIDQEYYYLTQGTKDFYFNIAGHVPYCSENTDGEGPFIQACYFEGESFNTIAVLPAIASTVGYPNGKGIDITYGGGPGFRTFTVSILCDPTTPYSLIGGVNTPTSTSFTIKVRSIYGCGIPFIDNKNIPGLPSWFEFSPLTNPDSTPPLIEMQ